MSGLFDTHCHVNVEEYFPDPQSAIADAELVDVTRMNLVGLEPETCRRAISLAEEHDGLYAIVGRHPNYAAGYGADEGKTIAEMLAHPRVVALGEIGLDFHWDHASRDQQERALFEQLDIAQTLEKPVVFHCREAYAELLDILERRTKLSYLFHCFSGTADDASRAQDLGCYFGFDGPITYKKADGLRALVATLPRDRIVIETDSPYLTPEPFRGKPNNPALLPLVNRALAGVLGISEDESADLTSRNAEAFFRL
jgi:TatD DNase family protein